jgi:hypothetical protein
MKTPDLFYTEGSLVSDNYLGRSWRAVVARSIRIARDMRHVIAPVQDIAGIKRLTGKFFLAVGRDRSIKIDRPTFSRTESRSAQIRCGTPLLIIHRSNSWFRLARLESYC